MHRGLAAQQAGLARLQAVGKGVEDGALVKQALFVLVGFHDDLPVVLFFLKLASAQPGPSAPEGPA
ncbi:hypothetical protein ACFRKE_04560 [Kitasatospora indigofera]|uniref:hypothetical protein n=1 Tax=Kitasatospora indigofera TaxID=67307 RepID=UPI0036746F3A